MPLRTDRRIQQRYLNQDTHNLPLDHAIKSHEHTSLPLQPLYQPQIIRGRIALGLSRRRAIKKKLDSLNESANGTGGVEPISGRIGNGNERNLRRPNRRVPRRWKWTGEIGIDLLAEESASGIVDHENENENVWVTG
jgi:hypothetical protein